MATAAELLLLVRAIDEFSPTMQKAAAGARAVGDAAKKAGSEAGGAFDGMKRGAEGAHGALGRLGETAGQVAGALGKIGLAKMGLDAITDAAKSAAGALGVGLAVEAENVRARLMAFTKDAGATDAILRQIRAEADKTPFSFAAIASATVGLLGPAKQANVNFMELVRTAEVLAALNPAEGLEGAAFALREAVSGDFTSIIERFNLPRTMINQLKAEGVPALEVVRRTMGSMGADMDMVSNLAATASGKWSTFGDAVDGVRVAVGRPILEALKGELDSLSRWMDANKGALQAFGADLGGGIAGGVRTAAGAFAAAWPHLKTFAGGIQQITEAAQFYYEQFQRLPTPIKVTTVAVLGLTAALTVLSAHPALAIITGLTLGLTYLAGRFRESADASRDFTDALSWTKSMAGAEAYSMQEYSKALDLIGQRSAGTGEKIAYLKDEAQRLHTETQKLAITQGLNSQAFRNAEGSYQTAVKLLKDLGVETTLLNDKQLKFTENTNGMGAAAGALARAAERLPQVSIPFKAELDEISKKAKEGADAFDLARKNIDGLVGQVTGAEQVLGRQAHALDAVASAMQAAYSSKSADSVTFWADKAREAAAASDLSGPPLDRLNDLIGQIERGGPGAAGALDQLKKVIADSKAPIDDTNKAYADQRVYMGDLAKEQLGLGGSLNTLAKSLDSFVTVFLLRMGVLPPESNKTAQAILKEFSLAQLMETLGVSAVQGFASGMIISKALAEEAARIVAQGATVEMASAIGAKSPSVVWRQYGRWAGEGFALGLEDGAPAAVAAAETFAAQATVPVASSARQMARDIAGIEVEIARLREAMTDTAAYSAERAAIAEQIQFLEGWRARLDAVRASQEALARAAELAKDPIDHFNETLAMLAENQAATARYGAAGADIIHLLAGVFDKPESAGQLAEAVSKWLASPDIKSLPGAAALGASLWDALRAYLAAPSAEGLAAVHALVGQLFEAAGGAAELNAANFAARFQQALALDGLRESMGSGMGGAFAELTRAIDAGGEGALDAAVGFMTNAHQELRKLPEFMRGKLGAEMKGAFDAFLANPTRDTLAVVQEAGRGIHEALALIPGDFTDMAASVQQAILAIIAAVDAGTLSIEEGGKRIKQLIDDTKKAADEAKRAQEEARRDAEKGAPSAESSWNIDTGNAGHAASGTARTNAGGIAGLTHSSVKAGDWQVEIFSATAALIAASSEFLRISRMGAFPAGTTLAQALGFAHQATFEAWEKAMKAAAGDKALRWGAAGREARGEWGGGALGAMDDAEFEQFLGTLSGPERDRARAERERAQAEQRTAARDQQAAATGQLNAATDQGQNTKDFGTDVDEFGQWVGELPKPAEGDGTPPPDVPEPPDEDKPKKPKPKDNEPESGDVPAHASGGVVSEFARLVNAAGQTIGTMAEQGPEAILPWDVFTGSYDLLRRFAGRPHMIAGEAPPLTSGAFVASPGAGGGLGGSDEALVQAVARGVAEGLHGALVQMDGQEVGRLVSRAIARDALLAGVNR